jgi:superfamily I DNA/RNA helicase
VSEDIFTIPDIIQVMDLKQEKLARGLGTGHRVIHGVAGSGKTMILGYRCLHLARLLHKPILVLCYNVTLAARLRELIETHGGNDRVNVYSIHSWASTILQSYNLSVPNLMGDNFDASIDKVIEQVGKGRIPRGQYGAVLIDEGHDFKPEWLRLVVDMVDPESNSLLLLYDDMQSIYKRSSGLGFTLKDVGIEAQGRSTILKLNYRNTEEVLKFAFDFIDEYVQPTESDDSGIPIVKPDTAGRRGALPVVKSFDSFDSEARYIARVFKELHAERGVAWSEMCVLYCHKWMGKAVADVMRDADIPFTWLKDSASKRRYSGSDDSVKVITMHSSKGLEFSTVAACGIGSMGTNTDRTEDEAKLLYVAMTRATENLLLTSSRSSVFSTKLAEIVERHKREIAARAWIKPWIRSALQNSIKGDKTTKNRYPFRPFTIR